VGEDGDGASGVPLRDAIDRDTDAAPECVGYLRPGNEVPPLLAQCTADVLIARPRQGPKIQPIDLAQEHFTEVFVVLRRDSQRGSQWGGRLHGPTQRRLIDGGNGFPSQPTCHGVGFHLASRI
jgi:hypothetical protein